MLSLRNKNFFIVVLIAVGFSVYAFNLNNPLFWDDDNWIKENVFVHDFSQLKEIFTQNILSGFGLNSNYYRPLLLLSFAVNYAIGGIKPLGYHLASNGFHIANGVLIFLLLSWVFSKQGPSLQLQGRPLLRLGVPFLAALLFLIHPLQTEAVTYISGRGDPMSVFFVLFALWFFIKTGLHTTTSNVVQLHDIRCRAKRWAWMVGALVSMILAILSRESAILLPPLLMVFYISFLSSEGFWKSFLAAFLKTSYFWAISVGYFVLRLTVLNFQNTLNFYSQTNDYTQHLSYRLYTFGHVLVEYFKLIFVPVGLHMERDLPLKTSLFQWPVWPVFLGLVALIVWLIFLYKKGQYAPNRIMNYESRINDESEAHNSKFLILNSNFRVWFFGVGWFFIGLAPVSGIIPINAVMYEHWLYLPLIGLFTLAGFYLAKVFDYLKSKSLNTYYLILATALVIYFSFFVIQSIKRNILWGKPIEFYENILKYNPNTVRIMNNLGNLYSEKGDIGKAEGLYIKAIESPNGNIFAQPHYNLGNIYRDKGETERAITQYKEAIKAGPIFPFAYQNLAVIYANRGQLVDAAEMLEKVKELRPSEPRVYYNLALIYVAQSKFELAIQNLEMGLEFSSKDLQTDTAIKRLLDKLR